MLLLLNLLWTSSTSITISYNTLTCAPVYNWTSNRYMVSIHLLKKIRDPCCGGVCSLSHKHLIVWVYIFSSAQDVLVCAKMSHCSVLQFNLTLAEFHIHFCLRSQHVEITTDPKYCKIKTLFCRLHLEWDNFHWFPNTSSKGRYSWWPLRFQIKIFVLFAPLLCTYMPQEVFQ